MANVIATWSGGKDSCLAMYKAMEAGYSVKYLANTISKKYKRVGFHGVEASVIQTQADCIGIPLLQQETTPDNYFEEFTLNLQKGIRDIYGVVFGDIFLEECFASSKKVCKDLDVELIEPLWQRTSESILEEFIDAGFQAIIVSAQRKFFGKGWVGRLIDRSFIRDIKKLKEIDLCGENGEYHSLVVDGPIFAQKIQITKSRPIERDGYWFLDMQKFMV